MGFSVDYLGIVWARLTASIHILLQTSELMPMTIGIVTAFFYYVVKTRLFKKR